MKSHRQLRDNPKWKRATELRGIRLDSKQLKKEIRRGETIDQAKLRLLYEARRLEREAGEEWKASRRG